MAPRRLFPDLFNPVDPNDLLGEEPDPTGLRNPDRTFYDDAGAGEGWSNPTTIASIGGFSSGMGQSFRTNANGGPMGRNPAASALPTASRAPAGEYETAPGGSGTLGRSANGTHPQDRAIPGGGTLADGQPKKEGGLLGWAKGNPWGDDEGGLLGGERAPTRAGLLGDMLLGASAGRGFGGMVQGAAAGLEGAQQHEQARRQQAFENEYRKARLAAEGGQSGGLVKLGAGDTLVDPNSREVVAKGESKPQSFGSLEAALMSPDPEVRARAEKLWREKKDDKGEITPYQQEALELQKQRLAMDASRANRPPGRAAPAAPTQLGKAMAEMEALAPDDPKRALYRDFITRMSRSGGSQGGTSDSSPPAGFVAPTMATQNDAQKKIIDFQTTLSKVEDFDKSFKPEYQTTGEGWGATVEALKERIGLEGDPTKRAELARVSDQKARIAEIASEYRHALFGAGLTGPELESAMQWMPDPGDSATVLKSKITNIKRVLRGKIVPLQNVLKTGIDVRPPADDPSPVAPPQPPQDVIRSPIQGPAVTDMPAPTDGEKYGDYARRLNRLGLSVEDAKKAAAEAFKDVQ